ncbi:MAG: hypothetical protein IJ865_09090 [Clostridia bacterium]|nr:hypothetical protein [Clostridia bacterium]
MGQKEIAVDLYRPWAKADGYMRADAQDENVDRKKGKSSRRTQLGKSGGFTNLGRYAILLAGYRTSFNAVP